MTDHRLEQVIHRIRQLSPETLEAVDCLLDALEGGDSSPLSFGTTEAQRFAARVAAAQQAAASKSGDKSPHSMDWPHAPVHRLSEIGTYMLTAGTLGKQHIFQRPERLDLLQSTILRTAKESGWHLEAWAVFSNHYHFVGHSGEKSAKLSALVKQVHAETSRAVNRLDHSPGRQVWHNFWDTQLTFEKSYLARLNYVHQNAVRHRLVPLASQYRWCSAGWFERSATQAQVRTIYSFKIDKLRVPDDFEPL
jgi:putative transposase